MDAFLVGLIIVIILIVFFISYTYVKNESAGNSNGGNSNNEGCSQTCTNGQQCINAACQTVQTDSEYACGSTYCTFGQWCNNGTCTAKNACTGTSCLAGHYCLAGLCQPINQTSACNGKVDMNNICQWCISNDQCPGQACINGYCVNVDCTEQSDCMPLNIGNLTESGKASFTCSSSNQCDVISYPSSCAVGEYFNGRICDTKPAWCIYDSDCVSIDTVCYNNMCLPSCDINTPNSCSATGSTVCAPTNPNNYVYNQESFSSACVNCTNPINCLGAEIKCATNTDCPQSQTAGGMICNLGTGLCELPASNVAGAACQLGYYENSNGTCTKNDGYGCFQWQEFIRGSDGTFDNYGYVCDSGGCSGSNQSYQNYLADTTRFPNGPPIGISMINVQNAGTNYAKNIPCVFVLNTTTSTNSYAPLFGYYDFNDNMFSTWDNNGGKLQSYSANEINMAYYLVNLCRKETAFWRVPFVASGSITITDKLMTFNGIPFCYSVAGAFPVGGDYGPSTFSSYNNGSTCTAICSVDSCGFGDYTTGMSPVYNSYMHGDINYLPQTSKVV